jgi:hypothetical protein
LFEREIRILGLKGNLFKKRKKTVLSSNPYDSNPQLKSDEGSISTIGQLRKIEIYDGFEG